LYAARIAAGATRAGMAARAAERGVVAAPERANEAAPESVHVATRKSFIWQMEKIFVRRRTRSTARRARDEPGGIAGGSFQEISDFWQTRDHGKHVRGKWVSTHDGDANTETGRRKSQCQIREVSMAVWRKRSPLLRTQLGSAWSRCGAQTPTMGE